MNQLVSVIIPVYNLGKFLSRSIPTILNQSYNDVEILLVDDGSKDNTLELCHAFATKDQRIRVIHQENAGVSAARNTGIENAQGKYIAFIDGDDIVAPFYIERLLKAVQGNVLSMCLHERVKSYDYTFSDEAETFGVFSAEECAKRVISGNFPVCVCGAAFDRTRIGDLRFPVGIRNNEDKCFLYHYLLNNEKGQLAFTNQKMYGYYVREGSATKTAWNGSMDTIEMANRMYELTMEKHPEWKNQAIQNQIAVRLGTLKEILKSAERTEAMDTAYKRIKAETLSLPLPREAGRTLKIEYNTLRCGNLPYKVLVKLYYRLMTEDMRMARNEHVSVQH